MDRQHDHTHERETELRDAAQAGKEAINCGSGYAQRWLEPGVDRTLLRPSIRSAAWMTESPSIEAARSFESSYPRSEVQGDDEHRLLSLVNGERTEAGLHTLEPDKGLLHLARTRAWDIIRHGYFSHESPIYGTIYDMMRSTGMPFGRAAENLGRAANIGVIHGRLMRSPGHRGNILGERHQHAGVAVLAGRPSGVVVAQVFLGW